ncbi:MAG: biopolymer transporter ExbD [Planctomycetota bacterium]
MFRSVRSQRKRRGNAEVQMAPLIDMVFILLIFFLVTTVFTRETGVVVNRPEATTSDSLDRKALQIGVDPEGRVYVEERRVDLIALRSVVEQKLRAEPGRNVVLIADRDTHTGTLVEIMDECRLAGASTIAIAATKN